MPKTPYFLSCTDVKEQNHREYHYPLAKPEELLRSNALEFKMLSDLL